MSSSSPAWVRVPERYLDADVLVRERSVLAKNWTYFGLARDLGDHNDWVAQSIGGTSVFVQNVRGELLAFRNTCPHRFSALRADRRGNGPMVCPYHQWSFDAAGLLKGCPTAPELVHAPSSERPSLEKWQVARCGQFLFVAREPRVTLADWLGDAFGKLEAFSSNVGELLWSDQIVVDANWKILVQNTLELEHVPSVHAESFAPLMPRPIKIAPIAEQTHVAYLAPLLPRPPVEGARAQQFVQVLEAAYAKRAIKNVDGYLHWLMFPNATFSCTQGRTIGLFRYEPIAVDQTRVEMTCYQARFDGLTPRERAAVSIDLQFDVQMTEILAREDAAQCKLVQQGLRSLGTDAAPEMFSAGEWAVRAFRDAYLQAMAGAE
ncbi:MAG TPA: SRPBCC family protein [Kofleriaceae bacterium]